MSEPSPDPPLDAPPSAYTEAIEALYDQFGRRLYRTAWGMLGRQEDAEDAVQEVFVALVRYQVKLEEVEDITAYLFTALRRAAARLWRKPARTPVFPRSEFLPPWPPVYGVPSSESAANP